MKIKHVVVTITLGFIQAIVGTGLVSAESNDSQVAAGLLVSVTKVDITDAKSANIQNGDLTPSTAGSKDFGIHTNALLPEIAVSGNGTVIADGDDTPSTSDHTDFGSVSVSSGTIVRTFTISNSGAGSLTLGQVTVIGPNAADFTVTLQPSTSVAANGTTTFQVTFNPLAGNVRLAAVSIPNNDEDENPYNFYIEGLGLAPEIDVTGNGVFIPDGDSTPRAADHTYFGDTPVAGGTVVRTFTIKNTGALVLGVSGVTISGPNAADFAVTQQPGGSVAATNGSTTFQVTFNPSALGIRNAFVNIASDDADEGSYNFSIQGNGVDLLPEVAVSDGAFTDIQDGDGYPSTADSTDFGAVYEGASQSRTFHIHNTGYTTLTVGTITLAGRDASEFIVTRQPATSVAAGGSTTFDLKFAPTLRAPNANYCTVSFTNNDADENPFEFDVQGTVLYPEIDVSGNNVEIVDGDTTPSAADHTDFGTLLVANGIITRTYTISNTGTSVLNIAGATIGGFHAADFSISLPPVATVAAGGSIDIGVTFHATAPGVRNAILNINSNDANEGVYNFSIKGTALSPEVTVSGNSTSIANGDSTPRTADHTDFGTVNVNGGTLVRTFTITNSGTAPMFVGGVGVSGTGAGSFTVTKQTSSPVAAGGNTTFEVTFDPGAAGLASAEVGFVTDDVDEGFYNFSIQGTGAAPEIAVTGNSVDIADGDATTSATDHTDFGDAVVGAGTVVRTFTIRNTGAASLAVSGITLTGPNAADFAVTQLPGASVAATGGSTTFQVTFTPGVGGTRKAVLNIANDDLDENPFNFSIQGTCLAPEIAVTGNGANIADGDTTPIDTDHTDFGNVKVSGGTLVRTFTITNPGTAPLTVGGVSLSGSGAASFSVTAQPASTVPFSASTSFQVTFDPSVAGLATARVNFTTNDTDETNFDFSIQGTGQIPEIVVSGNAVNIVDGYTTPNATDGTDFGGTPVAGGLVVRSFSIRNSGPASLAVSGVTITGANAAEFYVNRQASSSVASGVGIATFEVSFDPSAPGVRTATVNIANDDPDESPFDFAIQGTGLVPEIFVTGNGVEIVNGDTTPQAADHTDFGNVNVVGATVVRTFTIANPGTSPLTVPVVGFSGPGANNFSVTKQPSSQVSVAGSTTFAVTFDPVFEGLATAQVVIFTNDPDEAEYRFSIQGAGTGPGGLQDWRLANFATMENAGTAANNYDYEPDGLVNLVEFAFGLDPKGGNRDGTRLPVASRDSQGRLVLEFLRRKASTFPGITYSVETGAGPDGLTEMGLAGAVVSSVDATWERVTVTDVVAGPNRFGRVRVTEP